jgi:hypothetical protein
MPPLGEKRTGVDIFLEFLADVRKLYKMALATAAPIVASLVGLGPPGPVAPLASVAVILAMIGTFHFYGQVGRRAADKKMKLWLSLFGVSSLFYLAARQKFVFTIPGVGEIIHMGCGMRRDALDAARNLNIAVEGHCPGDGISLLQFVEYNPGRIWTAISLDIVYMALVVLWLAIFVSLAGALGTFLLFQRRKRARA